MPEATWTEWAWENRDKIARALSELRRWLWPDRQEELPGVLVLGAGGVGKSTLGMILSGQFDLLIDLPGSYDESLETEHYSFSDAPGLEILVPPGQPHRRESTWAEQLQKLSGGKFRGMILLGCHGYHNHEIGQLTSYKDHRLFHGNKSEFLRAFLNDKRCEELNVLREIAPKISPPAGGKFWLLSLVTKQDLWWDERAEVEAFYSKCDYAAEIDKIQIRHGARLFRHELALASLTISNFETGKGELLQPNTAGYDHRRHAISLRSLLEKLEGLRRWETGA